MTDLAKLVKPLVWREDEQDFRAETRMGRYLVAVVELHDGHRWGLWTPDACYQRQLTFHSWHHTEDAAKDTAQADYSARIVAAAEAAGLGDMLAEAEQRGRDAALQEAAAKAYDKLYRKQKFPEAQSARDAILALKGGAP